MAKRQILVGSTDQTIDVFIPDTSSTTAQGLAGLAFNTSNLECFYRKGATGSATQLVLATQTVGGAHSDGGFVEIEAADMKGWYRLDLSDAMVSSAGMLSIHLFGAANMAPIPIEIEVVNFSLIGQSATDLKDFADSGYNPVTHKVVTVETVNTVDAITGLTIASGTIGDTGNSTTALHLEGLTYGNDEINDHLLVIFDDSNNEYHSRWITDWADTGDLATVATLPFTPENDTDTYWVLAIRRDVSLGAGGISAATFAADVDAEILSYLVDDATRIDASALNTASTATGSNGSGLTEAGGTGDHLTAINLPNQTMDIVGNITGNLSGSVGSVTGSVGSVTAGVTLAASAVQAIWDALTSALTTVGSIGKWILDKLDVVLSTRAAATQVPQGFTDHWSVIVSGTVTTAVPTITSFAGDAGLSDVANEYKDMFVYFTTGVNAGLARKCNAYSGSTPTSHTFSFTDDPWITAVAQDDEFQVFGRAR